VSDAGHEVVARGTLACQSAEQTPPPGLKPCLILDAYAALKALFGFARMCEFCGSCLEPLKNSGPPGCFAHDAIRGARDRFCFKMAMANYLGNFRWVGLPFNMIFGLEILEGGSRKWVIVSPGLDSRGKFSAPNS
jgi:hypothetical protein